MPFHPDVPALYVTASVLLTTLAVYALHLAGTALGRVLFGAARDRA